MEEKKLELNKNITMMSIKPSSNLLTLKNNKSFCNRFFEQNKISSIIDELDYFGESQNLVYDLSHTHNFNDEAFGAIIDLLMQLRAAKDDPNVFIQNNTVVREQILNQLKNEILRVSHKLTKNQIKSLEVISSNSFDEKTLTDILKSLLESSKKKLIGSEPSVENFYATKKSNYITLDKASRSYFNILNKSRYYEKITDKILKNIFHEKTAEKNEFLNLKPKEKFLNSNNKIYLKQKSLKDLFIKKSNINNIEFLEEFIKFYEEKIINKMGLIPRKIKIQSKISEIKTLTKLSTLTHNITENLVPKLTSETELVNKITDVNKIAELRENIILNKEEYLKNQITQEKNIDYLYSKLEKINNHKNISQNMKDNTKSVSTQNLNIQESINKNLLKIINKKDTTNKFRNINETSSENILLNKELEKSELINKQSIQNITDEEKTAIRDIINLKNSGILINQKFIEDIRENNILMHENFTRRKNYERVNKILSKINADLYEDDNFKSTLISQNLINLKKSSANYFEDYFLKEKTTLIHQNKRNIFANKYQKIAESIDRKIKNEIVSISEKNVQEKFKIIYAQKKLNILNKNKIKPITSSKSIDGTRTEIRNKEDIYKFNPIHIKENILSEDLIENIFSKNIFKVLSPKVMSNKSFKINEKNIFRNLAERKINKYTEKLFGIKKEYLINDNLSLYKESQYGQIKENNLIYREIKNYNGNENITEKREKLIKKEKEPDIEFKEKKRSPEIFDTKAIEKNIMAKTLSKKDVVGLIESYMQEINVEAISKEVVGKVEQKFKMDRRRNGIF